METPQNELPKAVYFGINVEVVKKLTHMSLVRYGLNEFTVDTADLVMKDEQGAKHANAA